ncbi:DUF3313 family protein [Caballeronia telluris]|uniref:Lipoprotein n=1 Tax=Caballeronia telluris TaxID=326475 RepID=A0A158GGJ2_9BURK|nr:DUF3313 family protein [Caballeronia telluris]SAL31238.1 hypothetical protein AWB66_01817 [Caballeronia telluris]
MKEPLPSPACALRFAAPLMIALAVACGAARADGLIAPDVRLAPVPQLPGTTGYIAPDYDTQRAALHSIYLAPIEIFLAPDSPYKGIEPTQMAALTAAFTDILRADVLKNAVLVDTPQADSMIVQVALTDVRLTRRSFHPRDITPVGIVINGVKRVAGISKVSLATMTVQAEGLGPDGETLLFAIDNPPPRGDAAPEPVRLDEVPALLGAKASRLQSAFLAVRERR